MGPWWAPRAWTTSGAVSIPSTVCTRPLTVGSASPRVPTRSSRGFAVPEFAELRDDARFVDGETRGSATDRSSKPALTASLRTRRRKPGSTSSGGARGLRGAGRTGVAVAVPGRSRAGPARAGRAVRTSTVGRGVRHRGDDEDGRRADRSREAGTRDRSTHARGAGRARLQSERDRLAVRRGSGALTLPEPAERDTDGVADTNPLRGVVVLDLSTGIPGAYFSKLFADGGAEIILVEGPEGNTLRRWWSTSGAPPADGALFQFLSGAKRSVVADAGTAADLDLVTRLARSADIVVWSRGSRLAEHPPFPRVRSRARAGRGRHRAHTLRSRGPVGRSAGHRVHAAGLGGRHPRTRRVDGRRPGARRRPSRGMARRALRRGGRAHFVAAITGDRRR